MGVPSTSLYCMHLPLNPEPKTLALPQSLALPPSLNSSTHLLRTSSSSLPPPLPLFDAQMQLTIACAHADEHLNGASVLPPAKDSGGGEGRREGGGGGHITSSSTSSTSAELSKAQTQTNSISGYPGKPGSFGVGGGGRWSEGGDDEVYSRQGIVFAVPSSMGLVKPDEFGQA